MTITDDTAWAAVMRAVPRGPRAGQLGGTSPAFSLHEQHPSGAQYADYLHELAGMARLRDRVQLRTEVMQIVPGEDRFDVHVRRGGDDGVKREDIGR